MSETVLFNLDPKLVASTILVVVYIILFSEKLNRAVAALIGAGVMIFAGVLTQQEALKGIDFNTLMLLIGMMIIVGISEKSGVFKFLAIWAVQKAKVNPRGLLVVLAFITAIFSAVLDNVTTVLLIVPITVQITRKLNIDTYPYLILEIFASNIGGTATLIGDPPNILIGSAINLSFMDFVNELTPMVLITMLVLVFVFDLIYGKKLKTTKKKRALVMRINPLESVTDWRLLKQSMTVLLCVIVAFISAEHFHIANGTIALFGAAILMFIHTLGKNHSEREHLVEQAFSFVDWTTIFFFAGLFALVYGLEEAGVLQILGHHFSQLADGSIEKATMLIVWISAFVSSAIDNIPFVATMIPLVKTMEADMGGREAMMPVWWALSLGSCYGGNGSLIAASANVIVAGLAQKEGHPIHFMKFLLWSIPVMLGSVGIAALYLHIRHFM
ncbi:MAG: ArsB/NhaD family transporter [Alphaproteobacteria bacterium]|nr:ArsB/NhaD family transporter [Alphaproteobacteria bacterium]